MQRKEICGYLLIALKSALRLTPKSPKGDLHGALANACAPSLIDINDKTQPSSTLIHWNERLTGAVGQGIFVALKEYQVVSTPSTSSG
jgi:hypothetical protein